MDSSRPNKHVQVVQRSGFQRHIEKAGRLTEGYGIGLSVSMRLAYPELLLQEHGNTLTCCAARAKNGAVASHCPNPSNTSILALTSKQLAMKRIASSPCRFHPVASCGSQSGARNSSLLNLPPALTLQMYSYRGTTCWAASTYGQWLCRAAVCGFLVTFFLR